MAYNKKKEWTKFNFSFFYHDISMIVWIQLFHDQGCILLCLFLDVWEFIGRSAKGNNLHTYCLSQNMKTHEMLKRTTLLGYLQLLIYLAYLFDFFFCDSTICVFINPAIIFHHLRFQLQNNNEIIHLQQHYIETGITCQRKFEAWNRSSGWKSVPRNPATEPYWSNLLVYSSS